MTGTIVKNRPYSYRYGGKKIHVRAHTERHDPHVETEAEFYVAFELERHGWNVGLPVRRNQKGFDLYAEKDGHLLRVQVKGRTAERGINRLPHKPRHFDVLVCVLLRGNREPEEFVTTAEELKDRERWNPFPQRMLNLKRWDKLEEQRRTFTGQR